jgi:hypothetical protein
MEGFQGEDRHNPVGRNGPNLHTIAFSSHTSITYSKYLLGRIKVST